jgi:O-antigen/teichoic acid export membrane protein
MSLRARVLKGAAVLGAGKVGARLLSFVRNMIVARLLSPEDFGIAATFVITLQILDIISDLAADKLLVQSKEGDDPQMQATAHLWQFLRGLGCALIILALAWPASLLFNIPQARWAFYVLALVPIIRSLAHLDLLRVQRELNYAPAVLSDLAAQTVLVLAAWPVGKWVGSYAALLWLEIANSTLRTVCSHVLARRPYRWAWHPGHARQFLVFGWPLLINGLLMFIQMQGDRVVVGAFYSMYELGLYAVAAYATLVPSQSLAGVLVPILLPLLARVQDDRPRFWRLYAYSTECLTVIATLLAMLFIVAGGKLITLMLGSKYEGCAAIVAWLGCTQAVRQLRYMPGIAALALGDSQNMMWSNLYRVVGMVGMLVAGYVRAPIFWVAVPGLFAEAAAWWASVERLGKRHELPASLSLRPGLLACGGMLAGAALLVLRPAGSGWGMLTAATLITMGLFVLAALAWLPTFRSAAAEVVLGRLRTRDRPSMERS